MNINVSWNISFKSISTANWIILYVFLKQLFLTAEAIIPQEDVTKITPNGIVNIKENTYTKHLSFSYNRRYNFVLRWTWDGYKFFSTVALILYLIQGPPEQVQLGKVSHKMT